MPNRSKRPLIVSQQPFMLPDFDLESIRPGLKLLTVKDDTKKEIRLNFMVKRGIHAHRQELAITELLMPCLVGSTRGRKKEVIHAVLNNCATKIVGHANSDMLALSMMCDVPTDFLKVFQIFVDILSYPLFDKQEVAEVKREKRQSLEVMNKMPEVMGIKKIEELLYGKGHPYAYSLAEEDLKLVSSGKLKSMFYRIAWYDGIVVLTGAVEDSMVKAVKQKMKTLPKQERPVIPFPAFHPTKNGQEVINTPNDQQSTIQLATSTIRSTHPDSHALRLLCELLGGPYMGSLLMQHIREKKGLTYGIYCRLMRGKYDNAMLISASVTKGTAEETGRDILAQIKLLQEKPVKKKEVDLLKRHFQGSLLALMDNKIELGMTLGLMYIRGQEFSQFEEIYAKARTITPEELQEVARKHLKPGQFVQVIINP